MTLSSVTIQPISCHGEKVEVYRNLHKDCFSVRKRGKVIGYIHDDGLHFRGAGYEEWAKAAEQVIF